MHSLYGDLWKQNLQEDILWSSMRLLRAAYDARIAVGTVVARFASRPQYSMEITLIWLFKWFDNIKTYTQMFLCQNGGEIVADTWKYLPWDCIDDKSTLVSRQNGVD